ncbi:MAG: hypothetical protein KF768_09030 [Phycisphaeraceae bacterium]|nr:hypothetical protein [Phycisphaeraceae bacterium]
MQRETTIRAKAMMMGGLVLAGVAVVTAGPLNPPAGPVGPTGRTTDEIYGAIQGIAGSVAGQSGCETTSGGMPRTHVPTASFSAATVPGGGPGSSMAFVTDIVSMNYRGIRPAGTGSGGGGGTTYSVAEFTIVREAGLNSSQVHRLVTTGALIPTVTVKMGTVASPHTYDLKSVNVVSVEHRMAQRCDGTHVQLEHITLVPGEIRVQTSDGSWNWNVSTNMGN